jgi:hypothetical protein
MSRGDPLACRLPAPELQTTRQLRRIRMIASIASGARAITKEPPYRPHKTGTEAALVMLFPIFASAQFVEEQRTADEARDIDRLIAG